MKIEDFLPIVMTWVERVENWCVNDKWSFGKSICTNIPVIGYTYEGCTDITKQTWGWLIEDKNLRFLF